jgi:hypothetical protein
MAPLPMHRMPEIQALLLFIGGGIIAPLILPIRGIFLVVWVLGLLFYCRRHKAGPPFVEFTDLTGKVVVVTGCNTGLGRETVVKLAQQGASVVLACRSADRTAAALAQCQGAVKNGATAEFIRLDLQDFASVREFVATFQSKYKKLDILINNAGSY